MTFSLSARSLAALDGVHPDLVRVVHRAITLTSVDFVVTEGVRSIERQRRLLEQGATKTMNSRHLTGHAVDVAALVDGEIRWDWPLYHRIAVAFKHAAETERVAITWGGDWRNFKDGPHFELQWNAYPAPRKWPPAPDPTPVAVPLPAPSPAPPQRRSRAPLKITIGSEPGRLSLPDRLMLFWRSLF